MRKKFIHTIKTILCGLILSAPQCLDAVVIHTIDTTKPLKCTFSLHHQNRIAVHSGMVKKIICPENAFSIRMENESGQVFLFPIAPLKDFVTLSVITDNGTIQDLEIELMDKPSEVIILHEPVDQGNYGDITEGSVADEIVTKIKQILIGQIPSGYAKNEQKKGISTNNSSVKALTLTTFEGPFEVIYMLAISNMTRHEVDVTETDITSLKNNWVFLEKNKLKPKESIIGLVAVEKH